MANGLVKCVNLKNIKMLIWGVIQRSQYINVLKVFKGGNYMRKYGTYIISEKKPIAEKKKCNKILKGK